MIINKIVVPPKKIAVVSGGGGFMGCFEIGVLKTIEETKIPVHRFSSVSVTALSNAKYVADGGSVRELIPLWHALEKPTDVFKSIGVTHVYAALKEAIARSWREEKHLLRHFKVIHFLDDIVAETLDNLGAPYLIEPLIMLAAFINRHGLIQSSQEFIATTTHIPSKKVVYFSNRDPEMIADPIKLLTAIIASCSILGAFPPVPIHYRGKWGLYVDGASSRPLPIKKAIEEGYDTIIVIRCHSDETIRPLPRFMGKRLFYNLSINNERREKDEISLIKTSYQSQNFNLFMLEPKNMPITLDTATFKGDDLKEGIANGAETAKRDLEPLIRYFHAS